MTTRGDAKPSTIPPVNTAQLAEAALPGGDGDTSSQQLLASELEHLGDRRRAHGLRAPTRDNLTGLALSGGGIRSATFSLGVLQALAKYDLLKRFDYLSTVSGGGYTGASLTWWLSAQSGPKPEIRPKGAFGLGKKDFPYGTDNPTIWRGQPGTKPGPRLLTNLRKHGNYLTPGGGIRLLSGLVVVLRAVLVNLVVWLPLLTLVMLAVLAGLWWLFGPPPEPPVKPALASAGIVRLILIDGAIVALILGAMAGIYFALLGKPYAWASAAVASAESKRTSPPVLARFVVALIDGQLWGFWTVLLGAIVVVLLRLVPPEPHDQWHGLRIFLAGAAILATTFVLCSVIYALASPWRGAVRRFSYRLRRVFETWAAVYLPLIAVLAFLGALPDVAAWLSEPPAPEGAGAEAAAAEAQPGSEAGGGLLVLLAGIAAAGAAFLRSSARVTGMLRDRGFKVAGGFTATLAAALILTGVLLITHDLAVRLYIAGLTWTILGGLVALVLVAALMVNLNHISLGRFYRDRLMEAFMPGYAQALAGGIGASPREADEMRLHQASTAAPYHIVNTNVVLINARDRRRCLRGGDSFILTPKWCGSNATGWCRTEVFMNDGMTLATAMAISGAAANPNTGVGGVGLTRSRVVSVLMALLNLRLGYWVPHPGPRRQRDGTWTTTPRARQSAVPNHFHPGLSALLSGYHEDYPFQELTDGGHFENLGIYELIRRRVRLILVCDGGQDPDFAFEDLQTALRRIGEDFGAKIEFDEEDHRMEDMMSRPAEDAYPRNLRLARRGFAVARIHYPPDFDEYNLPKEVDQRPESTLIYLKTTMVDRLPLELRGYSGKNPDFPDQSTGDQFFDEDQFEAYRELGYRIAKSMIEKSDLGRLLTSAAGDSRAADGTTGEAGRYSEVAAG